MKTGPRKTRGVTHHPIIRAKRHQRIHEEAVNRVIQKLSWLNINGFDPTKIVLPPIKFPHIRHDREQTETGDIIFIWEKKEGEWEIVSIEVTTSYQAQPGKYFKRTEKTFRYLRYCWKNWLDRLELDYTGVSQLWFRPLVIFYSPHLFGFEAPSVIAGKRQRIF